MATSTMTSGRRESLTVACSWVRADWSSYPSPYGFEVYGEVSQYIVMMLVYGAAFDEDPALPWAAAILRGSYQSSDTRMLCLYSEAQKQMVRGREEVAS